MISNQITYGNPSIKLTTAFITFRALDPQRALKPAFAQIGEGLISLIEWITDSLGNYMAVFIPPRLGITSPQ